MPGMPQSNIHLDILMGRDETLEPEDFFLGSSTALVCADNADLPIGMEQNLPQNLHSEMEKKR